MLIQADLLSEERVCNYDQELLQTRTAQNKSFVIKIRFRIFYIDQEDFLKYSLWF
jgi:hypothetical protein